MTNTIKALDDWQLDVLGVPFGGPHNGKDAHGESFGTFTQFHDDKFGLPPIVYYHGYDSDGKPKGTPAYIGKATSREERPDGVWFRVVLDKTNELARRVWEAAKNGMARASSGTISHLRRVASDGRILEWPVAELSIFDTDGNRQPANSYAVALPVLKAMYTEAGLPLPVDIFPSQEAHGAEASGTDASARADGDTDNQLNISSVKGTKTMDPEEIQKMVDKAFKAKLEEQAAGERLAKQQAEELEKALTMAKAEWEAEAVKTNRLPNFGQAPAVVDSSHWKFDHLSPGELAMGIQVLREAQRKGNGTGTSDAAVKSLAMRLESSDAKGDEGYMEARGVMLKFIPDSVKANEIAQSTLANYGDEWVGVAYGTELWRNIRQSTEILRRQMAYAVPQPAGAETMYFPLEGADPTWYLVAQASALSANPGGVPTNTVTASKLGTAQQSRTMAKIGARMLWTGELSEDSVVNYASELRRQLTESGAEMLESLIINGDTATGATTNINDIGGTPAGTEYWLGVNGYRKLALVTNTANSRDGGAITEADFIETIKLMGLAGKNALGSDRVAFISDLHTYWKTLDLTSVKTRDVNSAATVETGRLVRMWGYDYLPSAFMHFPNADATYGLKANSAGKLDLDTASNNTLGALLSVRFDQWRPGYRRQMTTETTRIPAADATEIVALLRFGMIYRDTEASAISYNLTI